ncbi:MAG: glycosyltransferase family 4 protein [Candidatus Lokiarchaeota archaeon]|nr:glycosyltransferase family 4 protein [Candidatus Lokiarchaeota archaeon]MCK4479599.1 glycosyltransferase family 4 protein [Candidatus Lokiarchaeota archaeon]
MNNILYLPTRYFPSISGAEFYFQRMAELLTTKYNYGIEIYTSNAIDFKALRNSSGKILTPDNKYFYEVNRLKVNRFPVNYNISNKEILKILKVIPSYNALNLHDDVLEKIIRNGPYLGDLLDYLLKKQDLNYDLIHTTYFPYFNCVISLIIGTLLKKPTICTPFFHFSNPRYTDLKVIDLLKKFDLLIVCTNVEKEFLVQKCKIQPGQIKVIPMGVDYTKFQNFNKNTLSNLSFKEKFFNKNEKKYKLILFCGYKNYEKGALSILKSIPYILKKIKKVYFAFIGPSTVAFNRELSKIKKLEKVKIINFSPENLTGYFDKKKLAAFKEADIYLMPSRSDAFGISFLEAWSMGKPVIGARIGATPEVIRENIDGLLVEFDNPKDIAQKVIFLLKNNKLRKIYGSAGQLKVSQKYTWDIVAKETHYTYQNLLTKFR